MRVSHIASIGVLVLLSAAARPAEAARKPIRMFTNSVVTPAGTVFVYAMPRPERTSEIVLKSAFSRSAVDTIYVSQVDAGRGTYKEDGSRLRVTPSADAGDNLVTFPLIVVATPELRASTTPENWRKLVEEMLRSAATQGATLTLTDGSTSRALFGPDGNLIHFRHTPWYYRTNEKNEVIIRQYIGEPKDLYLGVFGLTFPVFAKAWKAAKPSTLTFGEHTLQFQ